MGHKIWILIFFTLHFFTLLHNSYSSSSSSDLFDSWCKKHGKTYPSEEERQLRLKIFEENLEFVNYHNSLGTSTYTLELNVYADLTHHEFRASKLGLSSFYANDLIRLKKSNPVQKPDVSVPDSLDWSVLMLKTFWDNPSSFATMAHSQEKRIQTRKKTTI